MSINSNNNLNAGNRTSIFETFNASNFDSEADVSDVPILKPVILPARPVKSVLRYQSSPPPPSVEEDVESFMEGGDDDVECIEEEVESETLFMSCSPGRVSEEEEDVSDEPLFPQAPEGKKIKKKQSTPKKVPVQLKVTKQDGSKHPKKPLSAYALFYRDTQAAIKSENPNAKFAEVAKIVASMWDSLDQSHKDAYEKQMEEAKEEFLQAMVKYRQTCKAQQRSMEEYKKDKTAHLRPYVASHKPSWSKTSTHSVDHNEDSRSSHGSQDTEASNKTVLSLCSRNNCPNRAVDDPRWCKDFCSTECVVNHSRDIFMAWVSTRRSSVKSSDIATS